MKIGVIAVTAAIFPLALSALVVLAQAQTELQNVSCAQEGSLRSINADTPTQVTFVNRGAVAIRTYWLNYQGRRVFYRDLAAGASYTQQTYLTHPWVITNNSSGECAALFLPASSPATAVIR
jgi:hypothetical protein